MHDVLVMSSYDAFFTQQVLFEYSRTSYCAEVDLKFLNCRFRFCIGISIFLRSQKYYRGADCGG